MAASSITPYRGERDQNDDHSSTESECLMKPFVPCRPNAHLGVRLCSVGVSQPVNRTCLALWSHHMVRRFRNIDKAFTWSALIGHIVGVYSVFKPMITSQWSLNRLASILNEVRPASPGFLFYHPTSNPRTSLLQFNKAAPFL